MVGALRMLPSWYERVSQAIERERHGQSWWELAVAWLLLIGFLVWRAVEYYDRVIWVPIFAAGFIYYFWPSLSWWGITVSILGALIAWAFAWLESAGGYVSPVTRRASDTNDLASTPKEQYDGDGLPGP
ncbi:hypothetical protein ACWDV4_10795 [Micromonospora sp. NPDC003197]